MYQAYTFSGEREESRGGLLSSVQRMNVTLHYLADPRYQKGFGQELGVDQATVSRTVRSLVDGIVAQAIN